MQETLPSRATGLDTDLHSGNQYRAVRSMYVFISGQMCDLSVKQLLVIPLLVESSTSFQPILHPTWIGMSPPGSEEQTHSIDSA